MKLGPFFCIIISALLNTMMSFRLYRPLGFMGKRLGRYASSRTSEMNIPPVSILAGFLGAGKTSTLTHILQNKEGLKVGVIVNDVASVNVDANVVKRLVSQEQSSDMIELENGCVCCGPEAGQLAPAVKSLAMKGHERGSPFDHIVIELSGVADPAMVRHLLDQGGVDVERVITLVDADSFPGLYHSSDVMETRDDLGGGVDATKADPCTGMKKVVELLISQIEEADVIIANKVDLASDISMKTTKFVCEALNPEALLQESKLGQLPLNQLLPPSQLNQTRMEFASHDHNHEHHASESGCSMHDCNDPSHDHNHEHHHKTFATDNLGITSFVYRADRPFNEHRLMTRVVDRWPIPQKDLLNLSDYANSNASLSEDTTGLFKPVLRSKGWVWLDKYPNQSVFWTHAGRHLGLELMPSEDDTQFQELVFIGMSLSEEKITDVLDACLVTDEELKTYNECAASNQPMNRHSELPTPRFVIGSLVEARTGPDSWEHGTIVALHYREATWPSSQVAPYQIKLEDGSLIYAPADVDEVVRERNSS